LTVFVIVELRTADPMLDLRLLTNRLFRSCNLVIVFAYGGFLGTLFIIPLYLQEARGISALNSGLSTFPEAVGVMAGTQVAGRLYPRIGPRRLMVFGLMTVSLAVASMSTLGATTSLWLVRGMMFAAGFGMAYMIIPQQAASFATIAPPDMGRAAAIVAAVRQTSAATGVAVLATVLSTSAAHGRLPVPDDFHPVFLVAAALALTGALLALRVRDEDAVATMGRAPSSGQPATSSAELPALAVES
jgi:MFS family permease